MELNKDIDSESFDSDDTEPATSLSKYHTDQHCVLNTVPYRTVPRRDETVRYGIVESWYETVCGII